MLQDVLLDEGLVSGNHKDRQPYPSQDTDVEDNEPTSRPPKKKSWSSDYDHAGQDGHQDEHEDFQTPLTLRRSRITKQAFGSTEDSSLSELSEEGTDNGKGKGKKNWMAKGKAKVNHKFASSFKNVSHCATLGNRLYRGRFVSHQLQIILMSNLASQGFCHRQQCQ